VGGRKYFFNKCVGMSDKPLPYKHIQDLTHKQLLQVMIDKLCCVSGRASYLLDDYSPAAAAYSLRYLKNTFVGNDVVTVRRSSDDAERGFTPTEIEDGTLVSWVGGGDGYVTTWYDQSGNGVDVANANASEQPKIVSSGYTILDNGKPSVQFVSVDSLYKTGLTDFVSGSFVYNFDISQNNMIVSQQGSTGNPYIFHSTSQVSFDGGVATNDEARMSLNGASLTSYAENQTGSYSINTQYHLYFNYDVSRSMDSSFNTLGYLTSGFGFSGKIQEIVVWTGDNDGFVTTWYDQRDGTLGTQTTQHKVRQRINQRL
jgi:hypothetical protein